MDLRVRLLRAWYYLRELLGVPRHLSADTFTRASSTTLLAGSPWIWITPSSSAGPDTLWIPEHIATTNVTWPLRQTDPPTGPTQGDPE